MRSTGERRTTTGASPAARRAIARWTCRLFAGEVRQQIVVVAVIATAVAAAVCAVATIYNLPDSSAARFGTAQQRLDYASTDRATIASMIESARTLLGTVDVIGHGSVPIPGSTDDYDARYQDPDGPYASSTLRIRHGTFPTTAAEVAITDQLATTFDVEIGGTMAIDGHVLTVVGFVENPYDLGDEFALLRPSPATPYTSVTILAKTTQEQLQSLPSRGNVEQRTSDISRAAAAATLAASAVVFLLVALVATAGFAVVAQRRMRQLGMLAAVGATDRHLRLVLLVHGAIVGIIASVTGSSLGLGVWFILAHRLETAAGHRLDAFHLPWPLLIGAFVAGVVVPIAAAWWPSRAMPRMSIVDAISARPPLPRRTRSSVLGSVVLLVAGVGLTALSEQTNAVLLIAGMVALVVGILLACPTAIAVMARSARRAPVTARVALRDLGRYQARAGAALGAISLALGIPVAIILVASAADRTAAASAKDGNLADTQLLITINHQSDPPAAPNLSAQQLTDLQPVIDQLATTLDHARLVPLEMAVNGPNAAAGRPMIDAGIPVAGSDNRFSAEPLFVATPLLLDYLQIDASSIPADAEVLATADRVVLAGTARRADLVDAFVIAGPRYTSLPRAFITEAGMQAEALRPTPIGWILESPQPLTATQIDHARKVAVSSGFRIEAKHGPTSRAALRNAVTAIGALFALAIVAMTVGTIRSEAAGELRTLTATGASSTIRRGLTAITAATLGLGGVALGTFGAYLGLIGAYAQHLGRLGDVPATNLIAALIGVPLLSCAVGWALGGREPVTFARQSTD